MAKNGTRQALFFDLHGILVRPWADREDYCNPTFYEGALDALRRVDPSRMDLFVATNQPAVAEGVLRERDFKRFQEAVCQRFELEGIPLRKFYACLYDPKGKGRWRKESVFRKPNTGMFRMAEQEFDLNLRRCWLIGDTTTDILAGSRANLGTILVRTGAAGQDDSFQIRPHFEEDDFEAAIRRLNYYELSLTR
ncbi:MAG: HAD-IIIA family hydrolase [Planctomycetes bacterium]|nr:HAD-IIIA family hydrolase [Planctomycetota bacterium]MCB9918956.1 HAD-IIIA family hydrolase [Planctomycetota bacterium]